MRLTFLQTPDPPHYRVNREYAGGMGVFVGLPTPGTAATTAFPNLQLAFAAGWASGTATTSPSSTRRPSSSTLMPRPLAWAAREPDFVVGLVSLPSIESDLPALAEVKAVCPERDHRRRRRRMLGAHRQDRESAGHRLRRRGRARIDRAASCGARSTPAFP